MFSQGNHLFQPIHQDQNVSQPKETSGRGEHSHYHPWDLHSSHAQIFQLPQYDGSDEVDKKAVSQQLLYEKSVNRRGHIRRDTEQAPHKIDKIDLDTPISTGDTKKTERRDQVASPYQRNLPSLHNHCNTTYSQYDHL